MHTKYIKKKGKKFGPYFYTTIRGRDGVARSYYLSRDRKKALKKEKELKAKIKNNVPLSKRKVSKQKRIERKTRKRTKKPAVRRRRYFRVLFPLSIAVVAIILVSGLSITGLFIQIIYQPGPASKDSYIVSNAANTNYGTSETMNAGRDTNQRQTRALIEFTLPTLPSSAKITYSELRLYMTAAQATTDNLTVHRIINSWTETGVTWKSRDGITDWTTAGGDFSGTVEDRVLIGTTLGWYSWNITNMVKNWYNGTYTNNGLIVKSELEALNTAEKTFGSSDNTNSTRRPILVINYTIPPDWSQQFQNTSVINQGDPVLVGAYWNNSVNVMYAWLATNESGTWQNKTVYGSPLLINSKTGWSNFTWQNASVAGGTVVGWRIYANNSEGQVNVTDIMTFIVDTTPPVVTLNFPPDSYNTSNNTVAFNWTVTDNLGTNMLCNLTIDGSVNASALSSVNNTPRTHTVPGFSEATHYWKIRCWDEVWNWGDSETRGFTVDTIKPTITIHSPLNQTYNYTNIDLKVTADEPIHTWKYSLNGGANLTFTPNTTITAQEGFNSIRVYANDTFAGNENSSIIYFTADATKPVVNINFPPDSYNTSSNTVTFNWTATDNVDTNITCNLTIDGVVNASGLSLINNTPRTYTVPGFSETTHYWNVTCWDDAYNKETPATRSFTVDTIKPTITIHSPLNQTYNYTNIDLKVTADEPIHTWKYSLNGGANLTFTPNTTITGTEGGVSNNVVVYANDTLGNVNGSVVYFTVDTPPEVTDPIPDPGYTLDVGVPCQKEIAANVTDDVGISSVRARITLPNTTVAYVPLTSSVGDKHNGTYTVPALEGTYNVLFIANDTFGNVNDTESTYFVGSLAPPVMNITFPENDTYSDADIPLNYTIIDTDPDTCYYILDSGSPQFMPNCSNAVLENLDNGTHTLFLSGNDSVGNEGNDSVSFTVIYTAHLVNTTNYLANQPVNIPTPGTNITLTVTTGQDVSGTIKITVAEAPFIEHNSITSPNFNRYVKIQAIPESFRNNITSVFMKMFHTDQEVQNRNINEGTLRIYRWNESQNSWIQLNTGLPFVNSSGVNTTGNYVFANLTELSFFTVSGSLIVPEQPPPSGGGPSRVVSPPSITFSADLQVPQTAEGKAGEEVGLRTVLTNTGGLLLTGCSLESEGDSVIVSSIFIGDVLAREEINMTIPIGIPAQTPAGDYNLTVRVICNEIEEIRHVFLKVLEAAPLPPVVVLPNCSDGMRNQDESDIDCGGSLCSPCPDGRRCMSDKDCINACFPVVGICYSTLTAVKVGPLEIMQWAVVLLAIVIIVLIIHIVKRMRRGVLEKTAEVAKDIGSEIKESFWKRKRDILISTISCYVLTSLPSIFLKKREKKKKPPKKKSG